MAATSVLHVTQVYAGGISRAITSLMEQTPNIEHHLLWAGHEEPDASLYASVHAMPQSPRAGLAAIRRVREVVDAVQPDVIHAHSSFGGVYARLARVKTPVVYQPHCYKFDDSGQPAVLRTGYRFAERLLAARAVRTIVLSPHEAALAKSLDRRAQTHFLPNVATMTPTDTAPSTGYAGAKSVFMIGRLTPQKDPEFFAELAEWVIARDAAFEFRWIGAGDASMQARLEDAGVRVLGWLVGDDLARELAVPGIYAHSAYYEGFPLSLLDAAAFEHPIAVRNIPTFEGLGIPGAETPEALGQILLDIASGDARRTEAAGAARRLNEAMNRDAQRESLRELYASL